MLDPKTFYRELDSILAKIRTEKTDENFFLSIIQEVQYKFGESLYIQNCHFYEKRGDEFILVRSTQEKKVRPIAGTIPVQTEAVQHVFRYGKMIYDKLYFMKDFDFGIDYEVITPAAISVHNPVKRWLFLFELKLGWIYEEINLFLNALRTALNYRLFSDMMRNDLMRAEQIQKSLLPKESPKLKGFDIFGHSQPAEVVGGDFYEYFTFDEDSFGLSIGDASGHGVPAALLVRDVVVGLRMGLTKEHRLVHTIKKLNQVIQRSTYSTNFISLFVGEVESDDHLFYVNAGHPAPFLIAGETVTDLEATGITLGFLPEIDLQRGYIHFQPGSVLVLYTDGIFERINSKEEQFSSERLKELIMEHKDKSAEDLVKLVFRKVYEFGGRKPWEDDATLVVLRKM
jgi:sigma-B regulation protein RsbU (phosphoserine phosphatase)